MKLLKTILFILFSSIAVNVFAQNVSGIIKNVKSQYAPDSRTAIFNISATNCASDTYRLTGETDQPQALNALIKELSAQNIKTDNQVLLLPDANLGDIKWAITKISVASHRCGSEHASEMATQSIMGTPLRVLQRDNSWYRVQTPDQYIAWVPSTSIQLMTDDEYNKWKSAKRYVVLPIACDMYEKASAKSDIVTDLVLSNILEYKGEKDKFIKLSTPDGREGYVLKTNVMELTEWASQSFDANKICSIAKSMMGRPYLWGGTSSKSTDCSGLMKISYLANGIILMRDASQQALTGHTINAQDWKQCQLGDLLFFGSESGRVTHVAMYLANGEYIHCSGRVKINSVDSSSSKYLTTPFLSISRISDSINTKGISSIKNNSCYFNK